MVVLDEGLDPIVDIKNSSFRTTPRGQFTGKETMICGKYNMFCFRDSIIITVVISQKKKEHKEHLKAFNKVI